MLKFAKLLHFLACDMRPHSKKLRLRKQDNFAAMLLKGSGLI
jgi:hypothetical protein